MQAGNLRLARCIHLVDERRLPQGVGIDHHGTCGCKGGIIKAGQSTGTRLNGHVEAELFQLLDGGRGGCHPGFTGETLSVYQSACLFPDVEYKVAITCSADELASQSCMGMQRIRHD